MLRKAGPHLRTEPRVAVVKASLRRPDLVDAALLTSLGGAEAACEALDAAGVWASAAQRARATVVGATASQTNLSDALAEATTASVVAPDRATEAHGAGLLGDWDIEVRNDVVHPDPVSSLALRVTAGRGGAATGT